jgi:hypothetical protein
LQHSPASIDGDWTIFTGKYAAWKGKSTCRYARTILDLLELHLDFSLNGNQTKAAFKLCPRAILIHSSQNTILRNLYFLLRRPVLRSQTLNLLDKILSLGNFPENNVLSIQPRSHNSGDEELRAAPKFPK